MNNSTFRFSVFLPVRNGGKYISLCVNSILAQTHQNFELVILENQSTDGTAEWLKTLEKKDSRVKVIPSRTSLSMEENWRRILSIPKSEFMTIIGHDDLLEPGFLKEINSLIQEEPAANLYLTHFKLIDGEGRLVRYCKPIPKLEDASEFVAARMTEIRDSFGTGYVMRSKHYDDVGGIPMYRNLMYADDALWLLLARNSYKATSSRVCFSCRLHSSSVSGRPNSVLLLRGLEQYLDLLHDRTRQDIKLEKTIQLYGPQYVNRCGQYLYYHYLLDRINVKSWLRRADRLKLSEIEQLINTYAPSTTLDKSYLHALERVYQKLKFWLVHKCSS